MLAKFFAKLKTSIGSEATEASQPNSQERPRYLRPGLPEDGPNWQNREWKYVNSLETDIRKTFAKAKERSKRNATAT